MRSAFSASVVVLLLCVTVHATPAAARATLEKGSDFPSAPLNETVLQLPGDPAREGTLQVTIMTPAGLGPFPLAVMNHGSPEHGASPAAMPRYRASFQAFYFLSRGYAVVLPMMRGYAGSAGRLVAFQCDMAALGQRNARDIAAVMAAVARDPRIDTTRAVVAGQSMGGWNSLALGAAAPASVRGIINFNGGVRESDCHDQDRALAVGAERFGRQTRIPSIWFYADNDPTFPPRVARAMFDSYTAAGGRAKMVDVGVVGENGHRFTASGEALKLWTPSVDAFLASVGLPSAVRYPQYMPLIPPPPSHFAAVDDVAAVPYLNEAARALYRKFLTQPLPRAFVLARTGLAEDAGGFDPLAVALRQCRAHYADCAVYAYDNDVVWTGPRP
jgi:dienelactone hydrolase